MGDFNEQVQSPDCNRAIPNIIIFLYRLQKNAALKLLSTFREYLVDCLLKSVTPIRDSLSSCFFTFPGKSREMQDK